MLRSRRRRMFIPLGDDNSKRERAPYVVTLLVVATCAVWLLQLSSPETLTIAYSTVPFEISHNTDLVAPTRVAHAREDINIHHARGPHPIRLTLLSSIFLHGSWLHLIGNMLYLWIFGDQIEDRLGHLRFLLFYLLCGVGASLAQIWSAPNSVIPTLGASGAIAGVLGAYLILYPTNWIRVLLLRDVGYIPALFVLGLWFVMQIVGQLGTVGANHGGIAYGAHIGGFLTGIILLPILSPRRSRTRQR